MGGGELLFPCQDHSEHRVRLDGSAWEEGQSSGGGYLEEVTYDTSGTSPILP